MLFWRLEIQHDPLPYDYMHITTFRKSLFLCLYYVPGGTADGEIMVFDGTYPWSKSVGGPISPGVGALGCGSKSS